MYKGQEMETNDDYDELQGNPCWPDDLFWKLSILILTNSLTLTPKVFIEYQKNWNQKMWNMKATFKQYFLYLKAINFTSKLCTVHISIELFASKY